MPVWRIFANPFTFTYEQRKAFAKDVTDLYSLRRGLPAFYVNVLFIDLEENQVWIGGEPKKNFVRIIIEQIARQLPDPETDSEAAAFRKKWMDMVNETVKPHITDRPELDWELHIYNTPRDLWRIQGVQPPLPESEEEKMWFRENKPVPYKN